MSNTELFPIVYQPGDPIPAALANLIADALERIFDQGTTGQILTKTVTGQGIETIAWAPPPAELAVPYQPPYVATFGANGTLTDFEITHNLGASTPHVQFWEPDGEGQFVQMALPDIISAADGNSISVSFDAEAPASGTVVNVSTGGGAGGAAITIVGSVAESADLADIVAPTLGDGYLAIDTHRIWVFTDSEDGAAVAGFDDAGNLAGVNFPLPLYAVTGYTATLPPGESIVTTYASVDAFVAAVVPTVAGQQCQLATGSAVVRLVAERSTGSFIWGHA